MLKCIMIYKLITLVCCLCLSISTIATTIVVYWSNNSIVIGIDSRITLISPVDGSRIYNSASKYFCLGSGCVAFSGIRRDEAGRYDVKGTFFKALLGNSFESGTRIADREIYDSAKSWICDLNRKQEYWGKREKSMNVIGYEVAGYTGLQTALVYSILMKEDDKQDGKVVFGSYWIKQNKIYFSGMYEDAKKEESAFETWPYTLKGKVAKLIDIETKASHGMTGYPIWVITITPDGKRSTKLFLRSQDIEQERTK
jgi:hypothetical protein